MSDSSLAECRRGCSRAAVAWAAAFAVIALMLVALLVLFFITMLRLPRQLVRGHTIAQVSDMVKRGRAMLSQPGDDDFALRDAIDKRVIVSLTTSPTRIHDLARNLQLLCPASYDEVHVNIPRRYRPTGEAYEVPQALLRMPKVRVFHMEEDIGPIMKMLPTIARLAPEERARTLVVSIDDDVAYRPTDLFDLLRAARDYDFEAVVNLEGLPLAELAGRARPLRLRPGDRAVDLVEGYSMVLYPAHLVDPAALLRLVGAARECLTSDDYTISRHLAARGVPRVHVEPRDGLRAYMFALSTGFGGQALHKKQDHMSTYKRCGQAIEKLGQ